MARKASEARGFWGCLLLLLLAMVGAVCIAAGVFLAAVSSIGGNGSGSLVLAIAGLVLLIVSLSVDGRRIYRDFHQ
jgi:uncharacterized membrane protein YhaH (DUF805 family)